MKALVAPLPRMLSDSGWLMTDMRHHSESERAGAGLRTVGAPLIRPVPYKPHSLPRPNHRYGMLPPIQPIPFIHLPVRTLNGDNNHFHQRSPAAQLHGMPQWERGHVFTVCVRRGRHVQTPRWHSGGFVFQAAEQPEVQSELLSVVLIRAR